MRHLNRDALEKGIDIQKIQKFERLDLLARQVVEGYMIGLHKSPYHGFSVEFAEHRLYNEGESIKDIDWKIYGKTEKLFVKKYEEEINLRCQLVLDISPSMFFPRKEENNEVFMNKFEFSVYSIAALIYLLKKQRDAFGLSLFDEDLRLHTPNKTTTLHQKYLFGQLETYLKHKPSATHKTATAKVLHEIAERLNRRSMVVIFTDMFDNTENLDTIFEALQHLRYNKHEVLLFHVYDGLKEIRFDYPNRPTRFVDMETGEEIKLIPSEIKNEYVERMKAFNEAVKTKSGLNKIDLIEADIRRGFDTVLSAYLLKRKKLY